MAAEENHPHPFVQDGDVVIQCSYNKMGYQNGLQAAAAAAASSKVNCHHTVICENHGQIRDIFHQKKG